MTLKKFMELFEAYDENENILAFVLAVYVERDDLDETFLFEIEARYWRYIAEDILKAEIETMYWPTEKTITVFIERREKSDDE